MKWRTGVPDRHLGSLMFGSHEGTGADKVLSAWTQVQEEMGEGREEPEEGGREKLEGGGGKRRGLEEEHRHRLGVGVGLQGGQLWHVCPSGSCRRKSQGVFSDQQEKKKKG